VAKQAGKQIFLDVAGFGEVSERNVSVQNYPLGDTKVVDDLEAHLIVGLFISTLEELDFNMGNNAYC
jgi:hypothetical protein